MNPRRIRRGIRECVENIVSRKIAIRDTRHLIHCIVWHLLPIELSLCLKSTVSSIPHSLQGPTCCVFTPAFSPRSNLLCLYSAFSPRSNLLCLYSRIQSKVQPAVSSIPHSVQGPTYCGAVPSIPHPHSVQGPTYCVFNPAFSPGSKFNVSFIPNFVEGLGSACVFNLILGCDSHTFWYKLMPLQYDKILEILLELDLTDELTQMEQHRRIMMVIRHFWRLRTFITISLSFILPEDLFSWNAYYVRNDSTVEDTYECMFQIDTGPWSNRGPRFPVQRILRLAGRLEQWRFANSSQTWIELSSACKRMYEIN